MTRTVLIIDDDDLLRNTLARGLRKENFDAIGAESGEEGFNILQKIRGDAIILDRMMAGIDGLSFLQRLRKSGDMTPVLMLTALSGPENAIEGLTGGANDYLAKPFQLRELVLRLNNIIKESGTGNHEPYLPDGMLFTGGEFFINGRLFALSGEEKKLLQSLVRPVGNIAPAAPMVAKRLRNKLNGVLSGIDVVTVRGKGYKLVHSI